MGYLDEGGLAHFWNNKIKSKLNALNESLTKTNSNVSENTNNISKNAKDIQSISTELSKKQDAMERGDDASDIDNMRTNGWYWIDPGKHAHTPFERWGTLYVLHGNTQIFMTYSRTDPKMVLRIHANGEWTPWAYSDGSLVSDLDRPLSKYKKWEGVVTVGADGRASIPWSSFGRTSKTTNVLVSSLSPGISIQYAYDDSTSTSLQVYAWYLNRATPVDKGSPVRLCAIVIN